MGTSHSRPSRPRHEATKNNPRSRGPNTSWKGSVRKERKRRLPEHEILVCPTRIPLDPGALIFGGFVNDCHRQSSPWSSRAFAPLSFRSKGNGALDFVSWSGRLISRRPLRASRAPAPYGLGLRRENGFRLAGGTENKVDASHRLIIQGCVDATRTL